MTLMKGLGTRIKALTQGIALGETHVLWVNNAHCPVDASDVFPHGVTGVEIQTVSAPRYTPQGGRPRGCMIPCDEAWRTVMDSFPPMNLNRYPNGIHYRGFHPRGKPWSDFRHDVEKFAATTEGQIFILADSMRDDIMNIIGDRAVLPSAEPLRGDFDRSRSQVLAHLHDWLQFVVTQDAISNHPRPAAMWARKFFQ